MKIILNQPYSFCQKGRRANQEDARFPDVDAPHECKPAFIVCDGVGGQDKGEVASRTVADAMGRYMESIDPAQPFNSADFSKMLEYAYDCLYKKMQTNSREMATTMTFAFFNRDGVFCAHMGDSRIYHVRPGVGIMYRSEDHSLVNALVHSGVITPEEAINHPQSNVITRCISYVDEGMDRPSSTTISIDDVEAGDYIFLCTDGVFHCITDNELLAILSSNTNDEEKIKHIAEKSKESSDNNTAYLIGVIQVAKDHEKTHTQRDGVVDSFTAPLERPQTVANETYANVTPAGNKILDFIKKLFK